MQLIFLIQYDIMNILPCQYIIVIANTYTFIGAYYTHLRLTIATHLILTTALSGENYNYIYFIDEFK